MLFNKNDKIANERIIYETRPNMILGCKKAILGIILLIIILSVASPVISYIGNMQVYLISYINVGLTHYTAIALFVLGVKQQIPHLDDRFCPGKILHCPFTSCAESITPPPLYRLCPVLRFLKNRLSA